MSIIKKPRATGRDYVNNRQFYEAIVAHKAAVEKARKEGKPEPKIPDYIGECIMKIAEKLSTKPCFINYSFRDEMISDGIENCFLYFHDYDPDYQYEKQPMESTKGPNPFAYFTQVIYYAFLRRINKEEKIRYTLYKNFQETVTHVSDASLLVDGDDKHVVSTSMYDNINVFMDKFEKKEEEKKVKRKRMKEGLQKFYEGETS